MTMTMMSSHTIRSGLKGLNSGVHAVQMVSWCQKVDIDANKQEHVKLFSHRHDVYYMTIIIKPGSLSLLVKTWTSP